MMNSEYCVFATPYYGRVIKPKYSFEYVYVISYISRKTGQVAKTEIAIWCGKGLENLGEWLLQQGVEVFFASDNCPTLERSLKGSNIRLYWNVEGDVDELIAAYLYPALKTWHRPRVEARAH